MRAISLVAACIILAHVTAEARRTIDVALTVTDLRQEGDGDCLADVNVSLPRIRQLGHVDHALLELWIEPASEPTDSVPLLISIVPLELSGGGGTTMVEGRWADAVIAEPWLAKRVVVDATRLIRYWRDTVDSSGIMSIRLVGHVPNIRPGISSERLGSDVIARLRIYATPLRSASVRDQ